MKKIRKIVMVFICLFSIVLVSGCESNDEDRTALLKVLQKEDIVSKDYKLIDTVTYSNSGIIPDYRVYYIYQNDSEDMIAINYYTDKLGQTNYDYSVIVYSNVTLRDDINEINVLDPDGSYRYTSNDNVTNLNMYNLEESKQYNFNKKKFLFIERYVLEK